jgi:hydroxyacylglutathione hydrolase
MNIEIQVLDLGFVNAFLIGVENGFILIDTGTAQQWHQLKSKLQQAGCVPGKLKLVIITHGDFDHTGNCARLQREYGTLIAMHAADINIVKTGVPLRHKASTRLGKLLLYLMVPANRNSNFDTFIPDIQLFDGQRLDEFGLAGRVIHTPGHTPGSIAVFTDQGHLFVGDTLSNRTVPGLAPFFQDYKGLLNSAEKIKSLGAKVIYPGHGKPFSMNALVI